MRAKIKDIKANLRKISQIRLLSYIKYKDLMYIDSEDNSHCQLFVVQNSGEGNSVADDAVQPERAGRRRSGKCCGKHVEFCERTD